MLLKIMTSISPGSNSLHILQWNVNGLKTNLPTLSLALADTRYDVVLQETSLKSDINPITIMAFTIALAQIEAPPSLFELIS